MIDAQRWQQLITSSFTLFEGIFDFTFGLYCRGKVRDDITNKFEQFRAEFWCQQHHWYTECVLSGHSAVIYTVPYVSHAYRLTTSSERYSTKPWKDAHLFDAVTDLTLSWETTQEKDPVAYFSNVTSLTFEATLGNTKQDVVQIESLQATMNFDRLTHLDISSCASVEASWLSAICTRATRLSSIELDPHTFSMLVDDQALSDSFKTMIRRLHIYKNGHHSFNDSRAVEQLCVAFPLLEQLDVLHRPC